MEEAYRSKAVREFLISKGIFTSNTEGFKNQNQVSEAINGRIKYLVTEILFCYLMGGANFKITKTTNIQIL